MRDVCWPFHFSRSPPDWVAAFSFSSFLGAFPFISARHYPLSLANMQSVWSLALLIITSACVCTSCVSQLSLTSTPFPHPPSLFAAWQNRSDSCGCDIREHLWVHVSGVSTLQLFMFSELEYSECKLNFAIPPQSLVCLHTHTQTHTHTQVSWNKWQSCHPVGV